MAETATPGRVVDFTREPILRMVPQPADMNGNGDIFGGWVMAQMDIAGGTGASRAAQVRKIGNTSVTVWLETVVERRLDPTPIRVTEGTFVFVAIDDSGKPRPVPK